ncbi:predicted protein [Histoplasma capsulatum G186AR]|uniref:Uncharacterized protein n=1 Tax=Ajellomyces capsulatus (strain G186AR / H82 / ATCC MYA-2454 / RMSCC 2432) TaxID=447093 RepID=C0NWX3_AJECG|nr:uncharacterized protein HCBG_07965 [Histoplasma capsulatum G186AR]EEH03839.1 predicted protein [Histoplasma capsulatum G186AR]
MSKGKTKDSPTQAIMEHTLCASHYRPTTTGTSQNLFSLFFFWWRISELLGGLVLFVARVNLILTAWTTQPAHQGLEGISVDMLLSLEDRSPFATPPRLVGEE